MPARRALREQDVHAFLSELYESDLHARRVYSLANATLGVLTSGSLAVHLIGLGLAQARGMSTKHSVKQVDRLLSNRGIDPWALFAQWVPYLVAQREAILVAMDWTEFEKDGHSTIMLSLLSSHGRSTPLVWQTVHKAALQGRRNDYEDQVLERLKQCLPAGVAVTVMADRGFCDQRLFEYLERELGFGYVIRMRGNINVTDTKGETRAAEDWVGKGGRARTLRGARVTDDGHPVASVVCVQARGMKEAWCLASSDPEAKAATLVNRYGKRWAIESSFRDTKDLRFGMGLAAVRTKDPERRDRLLLLNAFAVVLLSLLGAAGERLGYDRHLKANTVKTRTHSLFRQGCMLYELMPNMPEPKLRPLVEEFVRMMKEQPTFSAVLCVV